VIEQEVIDAAILVIEKAELMAKMGALPDFCGCTLEYVTTILTQDDERFKGRNQSEMRWDLWGAFLNNPDIYALNRDGSSRWGTRWGTMPTGKFIETFKPKSWLL